jgi:sRNA-binding carbon storage regulator CsrA
MADSTDNTQAGLRAAIDNDMAARARQSRAARKEAQAAQVRGDVVSASINAPNTVQVRGNQIAINIKNHDPSEQQAFKLPEYPECSEVAERTYVLGLVVPACGEGAPSLLWLPTTACAE